MQETTEIFWLWQFLGRLHPLIVHFPIGLLCVALLLEIVGWQRKSTELQAGIKAMVWIGTVSSVIAVGLGLLLANQDEYSGDTVTNHQWSGIATMVLAGATLFSLRSGRIPLYRSLLFLTVAGVTITGHYGALLTHGNDYLTSMFSPNRKKNSSGDAITDAQAKKPRFVLPTTNKPLVSKQIADLNIDVRTIMAHNCYKCHSATKSKGGLRLDTKELIFKGGEGGPVIVLGRPEKSELIRRIKLPAGHDDAMPTKGKMLSKEEIAILEYWIKQGAPWPTGTEKPVYQTAALAPRLPELPKAPAELSQPIDRLVNGYFKKKNITWKKAVDDHTYIRRVYLDVIGLLPSPENVEIFVADTRADKREILVKELLNHNEDYAQHWLTFWNDALRNDYTGTGYITGGRFDITKWLYASLKSNKPYNQFVKELISPKKESAGFIKGIKWRGTINASQRNEMQAAQNVAQVFLGLNLKCASCHDSFISNWKLEDAYAFANIFADSTLEIHRCDKPTGKMVKSRMLFKELGEIKETPITEDRLRELADFLIQPKDGRLYRTLVNRVWAQLMGRGIVEPVDMMDNVPWSQDLLDWLAADFVANGYDLKRLMFNILTSKTYQLPSIGIKDAALVTAPNYTFKGMIRRRMTAEQFADAVSMAINPVYKDSAIVFKLLPDGIFKEMPFARASLVKNDPFLTALGRPTRETVSTSRNSQANLLQALELTNGIKFNEALKKGAKIWKDKYPSGDLLVKELYKKSLGREPMPKEMLVAQRIMGQSPSIEDIEDLVWAMTLHPEFQLIY
ncbi:DUF1549 domain-containing protein [Runella sp.]|uniref:DUF1549 domain-containing protein n=1 Tax=Runella sp. TaxID=1960881 RepID=UPI002605C3F0|nr:DUF1549 domain-containing protein [Runella sp.]